MADFILNQQKEFAFNNPLLHLAANLNDVDFGSFLLKKFDVNLIDEQ